MYELLIFFFGEIDILESSLSFFLSFFCCCCCCCEIGIRKKEKKKKYEITWRMVYSKEKSERKKRNYEKECLLFFLGLPSLASGPFSHMSQHEPPCSDSKGNPK